MAFPDKHKSRTTFESCGENAPKAAEEFAKLISDAGFDAEITDDGAVEHTCEDADVFAPLAMQAEEPYLEKRPAKEPAKKPQGEHQPKP